MTRTMSRRIAGVLAVATVIYRLLLRRAILTWGATAAEAAARLPGDELLEDADGVSTRAITIDAPASAVWPWLAQMGPSPRGGAYTYDWIENLLGLDMHSVDRVLPEFQHPQVGDTIGFGANRMRLERVEPERVLAWRSEDGNWVWTFVLDEHDGDTRLISRNRFRLPTLVARHRDGADGAGVARDGAQDAARHQAARRAACRRGSKNSNQNEPRRPGVMGECDARTQGAPIVALSARPRTRQRAAQRVRRAQRPHCDSSSKVSSGDMGTPAARTPAGAEAGEIEVTLSASGPRYVSADAEFAVWSATLGEEATASRSRLAGPLGARDARATSSSAPARSPSIARARLAVRRRVVPLGAAAVGGGDRALARERACRGSGATFARAIVDHFGAEHVFEELDRDPERLREVRTRSGRAISREGRRARDRRLAGGRDGPRGRGVPLHARHQRRARGPPRAPATATTSSPCSRRTRTG